MREISPPRLAGGRARIFPVMITTVHIDGMRTVHCVRAVYTAFAGVADLEAAEVVIGLATLEHSRELDATALTSAVALAGYTVRAIASDRRRLRTMPMPGEVALDPAPLHPASPDAPMPDASMPNTPREPAPTADESAPGYNENQ